MSEKNEETTNVTEQEVKEDVAAETRDKSSAVEAISTTNTNEEEDADALAVASSEAKTQEPSSGTDDDEPSAQPAVQPGGINPGPQSADAEESGATMEREMTPEETRVAFVNEGLIRWEAARQEWLGVRANGNGGSSAAPPKAIPLDVDKIIDVLFYASARESRNANGAPEKFPRNVPLPQMVDILQDLWEAEGLDA